MQSEAEKDQNAYVQDILDSAKQAVAYVHGLTFDKFWDDQKTRDAVAMRLHVMGESAKKLKTETAAALGILPVEKIRGMRNRIAHDYCRVNFRIVWKTVREDLPPLIDELERHLRQVNQEQALAQKIQQAHHHKIESPQSRQGPRMGM